MKRIKSYQLFLENKSQLESVVIEFLIYNERKLGLYFDRFDLINGDNGEIMYITAFTKEGPNGKIPDVDKIVFDIFDFQKWIIERSITLDGYNSDTSWKSAKTIEDNILKMKTNILRNILVPDPYEKIHDEPSENNKKLLDKAFNFKNVWDISKDKVIKIIHILNKYDIEDIEDRMVEFTDEITEWKPKMMFAYYRVNSWHGINTHKINIDDMTCRFIWDAWYSSKSDKFSLDNFIKSVSPCLFVQLNYDSDNYEDKNLNIIEEIADRIVLRFKSLYDIDDVILPYSRIERKYDDKMSKISNYDMTFILK